MECCVRSYTDLLRFSTLRGRYDYLKLDGEVGCPTFGSARWMNQAFYRSREWKDLRQYIIFRDGGCDLGVEGHDIHSRALVHHLNPITQEDVEQRRPCLFDPNNLITTTHDTHNAIHYGDERLLPQDLIVRREGDTREWEMPRWTPSPAHRDFPHMDPSQRG